MGGIPKSSIYRWIFHETNHPFGGTTIYGKPQRAEKSCEAQLQNVETFLAEMPHGNWQRVSAYNQWGYHKINKPMG